MIYSIHVGYPVSTNLLRLAHCTFKPPRFKLQSTCICHPLEIMSSSLLLLLSQIFNIFFHEIPSHHLVASKVTRLQVPRHTRQLNHQPIQLLTHANLTSQARRLGQPKRQIQHVVLVIARLLHLIKHLLARNDNMASRASARPTASAFHFEIVGLCDVEQVVAVGDFEGYF